MANRTQFIIGAIKHKAVDRFRKLPYEDCDSEFVEASASGDEPLAQRASIKIYLDALKARLGSDEYSILYDKYGLGLTYKALGEKNGLSLDQAVYRVALALKSAEQVASEKFIILVH